MVEALLAGSILSLLALIVFGGLFYGKEATSLAGARARATFLAEEGLEAARNIRDNSYTDLGVGSQGLVILGNEWILSGSSDVTEGFTRQIAVASVDATRKDVTSTVTWQQNPARTGNVTLTTRFTNWIQSVGGWANPFVQASLDLPGTTDGLKVQAQGNYAYVVRNDGTPDFVVIDVSNASSPSIAGSLSLIDAPTNIFVSGDYAYVSSRSDLQELQIINISNPSLPIQVGFFNASGSADALGVYVVGTTVYLTRASSSADEFLIINASTPILPTLVGSLDLGATGNEVFISGSHAYVASAHDFQELQVVSVSTPSTPAIVASHDFTGNQDSITIAGFGSTILLGRTANVNIFDVSTPTAPSIISSYGVAGNVNDIALNVGGADTFAYTVTANSSLEFEAVDITNTSSPTSLGGINLTGLNGVAYSSSLNRVFAVGESDTEEFLVIAPQ